MSSFPIPAPLFNGKSRTVGIGNTLLWLHQGWLIFIANPGQWILLTALFLLIQTTLVFIPLVGQIVASLLMPVFAAGFLYVSQQISKDNATTLADLFIGFTKNAQGLVILGILYAVGAFLVVFVAGLIGGALLAGTILSQITVLIVLTFLALLLLAPLFILMLTLPLLMAVWFAPALVFFNNLSPTDAVKASFSACLKNILPFIIYGLIAGVLFCIAALPVGLGLLILIPVLSGSIYASYHDIFLAN